MGRQKFYIDAILPARQAILHPRTRRWGCRNRSGDIILQIFTRSGGLTLRRAIYKDKLKINKNQRLHKTFSVF